MDITKGMFAAIFAADSVTPSFLKIMQGFGRKTSSKDEDFMACYRDISLDQKDPQPCNSRDLDAKKQMEVDKIVSGTLTSSVRLNFANPTGVFIALSYNIRQFERHGRDLDDPWSCRQSAIHHRLVFSGTDCVQSSIVIIQPPEAIQQDLVQPNSHRNSHPMDVHLRFLHRGLLNWREYLNYISDNLRDLVSYFFSAPEGMINFHSQFTQNVSGRISDP